MADNFDRSLLVYGLLIKWVENIMDYNDNSMKAAYRCVVLAASGDGKVSDDELESALSNTEWTENYTQFMLGASGILDDMFSELFGIEPEEEEAEEEEDLVFEALTEDEKRNSRRCSTNLASVTEFQI